VFAGDEGGGQEGEESGRELHLGRGASSKLVKILTVRDRGMSRK
jgi:hypothetical protein